jgi:hypothetical protein
MGGTCGTSERNEKCIQNFRDQRDQAEDLGRNRKILLEWVLENRVGRCGIDASGLA